MVFAELGQKVFRKRLIKQKALYSPVTMVIPPHQPLRREPGVGRGSPPVFVAEACSYPGFFWEAASRYNSRERLIT